MNDLLQSSLRELDVEHGVKLDAIEDVHHILRLKILCDRVLRVQADIRTRAVLNPVVCLGSVELRRLSIGAVEFLRENVCEWFEVGDYWFSMSFAYCHAHVETPAAIWGCEGDVDQWKKRVRTWARSLDVSEPELFAALDQFQKEREAADAELELLRTGNGTKAEQDGEVPGSAAYGPIVEVLASTFGFAERAGLTPAEYWIWRVPADQVRLLSDAYFDRKERETRLSNAVKGGKSVGHDPDKQYLRAHFALRLYLDEIVKEKRGADNGGQ